MTGVKSQFRQHSEDLEVLHASPELSVLSRVLGNPLQPLPGVHQGHASGLYNSSSDLSISNILTEALLIHSKLEDTIDRTCRAFEATGK